MAAPRNNNLLLRPKPISREKALQQSIKGITDYYEKRPKEKLTKSTVEIKDTRKYNPITKSAIVPTKDLVGGEYRKDVINDILSESKSQGLSKRDALNIAAMSLSETGFGKRGKYLDSNKFDPEYTNPMHFSYERHGIEDPYRSAINAGYIYEGITPSEEKRAMRKFSVNQSIKDYKKAMASDKRGEAFQITRYNNPNMNVMKPGKVEYGASSYYGLPLPIDPNVNPVYGTRVINLRDSVLMKSPQFMKEVEKYYPTAIPYRPTYLGPIKKADGGEIPSWSPGMTGPPPMPMGFSPEQRERFGLYTEQGDTPYNLQYNAGRYLGVPAGMSMHYGDETGVPDSPCGPGFAIDYDANGFEVCVPIGLKTSGVTPAAVVTSTGSSYGNIGPRTIEEARMRHLRNMAARGPQKRLETFSEEYTMAPVSGTLKTQYTEPFKRKSKLGKEPKAKRKLRKGSSFHRGTGFSKFFRGLGTAIRECLPGEDCPKMERGGWVYPANTAYPAYGMGGRLTEEGKEARKRAPRTYNYPDPSNVTSGRFTQRSIGNTPGGGYMSFADGGNITPYNISDPVEFEKANRAYQDSLSLFNKFNRIPSSGFQYFGNSAGSKYYSPETQNFVDSNKIKPIKSRSISKAEDIPVYKKPVRKPVYTPKPEYNITQYSEPMGPPNIEIPKEETIMMPTGSKMKRADFEKQYGSKVTQREFQKKAKGGQVTWQIID